MKKELKTNVMRILEKEKVPYMLVVGDKEMNGDKLAVRQRGSAETVFIKDGGELQKFSAASLAVGNFLASGGK